MNMTDLKQDLDSLVRDVSADDRLAAGVASKVRARKRARAAGVGAACVALLALGAGVTTQLNGGARTPTPATSGHAMPQPTPTITGTDGMPTRAVPLAPGDLVKDGLRFRAGVAGARLAAGAIGTPGQPSLELEWTPTTTRVTIAAQCWAVEAGADGVPAVDLQVSLDGSSQMDLQGACVPGSPLPVLNATGLTPGKTGAGWDLLQVGHPARLTFRTINGKTGKPVTDKSVRITAAVYYRGPEQLIMDPTTGEALVALPEQIEHEGHRYGLARLVSGPSDEKLAAAQTPAGEPFLVTFGAVGAGSVTDSLVPIGVRLTGLSLDTGVLEGGWTTVPEPARMAGSVELVREGPRTSSRGVDFMAIYTLDN